MTETLRIDLHILLPQVPHEADACVGRLIDDLKGRNGIQEVHVRAGVGSTPAQVCIHYDPDTVPLARIRDLVEGAGAAISDRYGHVLWEVEGIGHERRARTVAERLKSLPGILGAEASATGMMHVEFDRSEVSEDRILAVLARMKIVPASGKGKQHGKAEHVHRDGDGHAHGKDERHAHGGLLGPNTELIFAL